MKPQVLTAACLLFLAKLATFRANFELAKAHEMPAPAPAPVEATPRPLRTVSSLSWVSKSSCRADYVTPFCYLFLLPQSLYYYVFVVGNELSALSMQVLYSLVYVYSLSSEFRGACHCHCCSPLNDLPNSNRSKLVEMGAGLLWYIGIGNRRW